MDRDFRYKYKQKTNITTQISMFFINLVTLRAFVLRPEEVQFNMANIGMPSFPYSFQAFEMANNM